jgi:hypothetical protein
MAGATVHGRSVPGQIWGKYCGRTQTASPLDVAVTVNRGTGGPSSVPTTGWCNAVENHILDAVGVKGPTGNGIEYRRVTGGSGGMAAVAGEERIAAVVGYMSGVGK